MKKQLHERPATSTDRGKSIHCTIEIEAGLLTLVERRFGQVALFAAKLQHVEGLLGHLDFVAGNNVVGFTQRSHNRKCSFDQFCLCNLQTAYRSYLKGFARHVAYESADEKSDRSAGKQTDHCANKC